MASLLERKLIVVTGKGGTGKSTVACALGLIGARRGLRTIVAELGDQHRIPELFEARGAGTEHPDTEHTKVERDDCEHIDPDRPDHLRHGRHTGVLRLQESLWSTSIDPDRALIEWLHTLSGRISGRLLAASNTFHYFAAAAPGAKELVTMVRVRELCEGRGAAKRGSSNSSREQRDSAPYDLVILDAPATGHALALLRSPQTFASIVRVGPLAEQAQSVRRLLEDPQRSSYVAVAQGTEMAITETLELEEGLRRQLDRDLDAVVVNGTLPRRFTREELGQIERLDDSTGVVRGAARMAHAVYERARLQQSQIARLRRQRFAQGLPPSVLTLPMLFTPELNLADVREMSAKLERKL
ncbi:MAG TPA: ArsA-related P-loop ATPase [Solirubrobacteraceae bacterium]|jgi:anion-transporting  ArsA/GET3 family ATPase|nr:ArsA-related P-loop ATPase [Solirubrobacteraceae bacterium]